MKNVNFAINGLGRIGKLLFRALRVTLDVGFYYMANAAGRLIRTLFSGLSYTFGGIEFCLFVSSVFLLINRLSINKLEN